MEMELKRPEKKDASVKVSEEDMIYFSLGIDRSEFILPSQRLDYHSDSRAVQLVRAIRDGKKVTGQDFSGLNLKGADISGATFDKCSFKGAVFYKTNAETCDFSNCCFDEAYMEDSNFMGCDFTGASFRRVFSKNNNWEKAFLDEEASQYLNTLEQIIKLIEQGKIDIRSLSKSDLLHLDIRRLDFSKIDLEDLDLSMFVLDGINLSGTYIDPKQLMSLEGWNSYCLDLRKTKDITRERLCRKVMIEKDEELRRFAELQKKTSETVKTEKGKRPKVKQAEHAENRAWGIEKARREFAQIQQAEQVEKQKHELEESALYEAYQKEYQKEYQATETVNTKLQPRFENQNADIGIRVTPENIRALDSELKTEIPFSLVSTEVGRNVPQPQKANSQKDLSVEMNQKSGSQGVDINLNNKIKSDKQQIEIKKENERKEPVLIIAHEEVDRSAELATNQQENKIVELDVKLESGIVKQTISTTPYPYFKESEQSTEQEPVKPKKTASDDEETIHSLQNAGFSIEEITQMLRQKGPLKVMGKLPKGRKVNNKSKG